MSWIPSQWQNETSPQEKRGLCQVGRTGNSLRPQDWGTGWGIDRTRPGISQTLRDKFSRKEEGNVEAWGQRRTGTQRQALQEKHNITHQRVWPHPQIRSQWKNRPSTSYTRKRKIRINKYDEKWGERRKTINTPERHIQTWTVKGYSLVRERPSTCPFFLHQGTIWAHNWNTNKFAFIPLRHLILNSDGL